MKCGSSTRITPQYELLRFAEAFTTFASNGAGKQSLLRRVEIRGQSLAFAARLFGFSAVFVVPQGNSEEKNAAMVALGPKLMIRGSDFQKALEFAGRFAQEHGLLAVSSFDPLRSRE